MKFFNVFFLMFCAITKADFAGKDTLDWWQTSVIYQIYPRSFKDSDSDGIGDLKGIEEKAEYLKDLGIGTVWLSPVFKSPMTDMGYDISDFKAIDPIFGTLNDFESLRDKLHSFGIKLTLDFVPNHSSDEHEWFIKSVQKIDPYTDYYVWKDPKGWINDTTPVPPNNWIGPFEISTWTYHPDRKQFYFHQFASKQPDLNYRSKELVEEMKNVIRFWLDKGVDGFRMDAVPYLVEDERFLDEPIISNRMVNGKPAYNAFDHIYTQCLPETYDIFRQFRETADSYKQKDGQTRLIMVEAYATTENTMKFYGTQSHPIAQMPFNFFLLGSLKDTSSAFDFQNAINKWLNNMPLGEWPNWVPSYNGEEIGMEGTKIRWDQTTDISALGLGPLLYRTLSRDPERAPFQWDSSIHAGFSGTNKRTWLPVNPNYYRLNVQTQTDNPSSHLNTYKKLIKLRSSEVFRHGDFKMYNVSERIFAFKRSLPKETYVILMNLNNEEEFVEINNTINDINQNFEIIVVSENSEHEVGNKLNTSINGFKMRPKSAIALKES